MSDERLLRHCDVSRPTFDRYVALLYGLLEYMRENELQVVDKEVEVDLILTQYIEDMYYEGAAYSRAEKTVSALQFFFPYFRKKLPLSWKTIKAWNRSRGDRHIPPMPSCVAVAMAAIAVGAGLPELALGILLGFHCLLRPGEICDLQWSDIRSVHGSRILMLKDTKTSKRTGLEESVVIEDPLILNFLASLPEAEGFLLPGISSARRGFFRQRFKAILDLLEIDIGLRPASIRGGGATFEWLSCGLLNKVKKRGRWQHEKTCEIYIQPIKAGQLWDSLPDHVRERAQAAVDVFVACYS